jgi:hypothetical protein
LTIAGNILDLWINTLNKYSLDGSLTFLTYKWCIYIYYIYIIYILISSRSLGFETSSRRKPQ